MPSEFLTPELSDYAVKLKDNVLTVTTRILKIDNKVEAVKLYGSFARWLKNKEERLLYKNLFSLTSDADLYVKPGVVFQSRQDAYSYLDTLGEAFSGFTNISLMIHNTMHDVDVEFQMKLLMKQVNNDGISIFPDNDLIQYTW